ncbi:MAG: undecaprenyl/decaprenyl-phosphate alpha-N-acetylglucosaminyl 1-phosphate transferase [Acidimicrobiia bacterium]|nr:undecaprenyl/decaprenyl-phosphate alpha-N-acetylglucosaminyl 1-phosphate transferase [Acidimicrobiia bacterium]
MAAVAVAILIALGWAALALWLGPLFGFVDRPDSNELKVHTRPAVPLGGVGVFLAIHTAMAMEGIYDAGLAAATGGLLLLGLLDDRFQLSALIRLAVEVPLAGVLVVFANHGWPADPLPVVVGVGIVVVAINAVNLFDGLDGLVGTTAIVSAIGLTLLANDRGLNGMYGLLLAAALLGFLVLNWHRARVFLGDNGSYTVGAFLAYGIMIVSPDSVDSRFIVGALLLGVFAVDLAATIVRRRLHGRPLFAGDRSHIYDQLHDRGWSVPRVVLSIAIAQAVFVGLALGVEQIRNGPGRIAAVAILVASSMVAVRLGGFWRRQPD